MATYKVITLPLAEEDIADQTDYIAFDLKSRKPKIVYILRVFHMRVDSKAKILKMYRE